MKGEVIGINSQIYSRTGGFMGLSFAIPIDVALQVSDQLRSTGHVTRGWLGVVIQDVTKELADSFGLSKPQGALVSSVEKGSPAEKGGILTSDIILRFDNKPIKAREDLPRLVSAVKSGSRVSVQVWRKGAAVELSLLVGEMPGEKTAAAEPSTAKRVKTVAAERLGLSMLDLSPDQRKELEVAGGVLVDEAHGPAAKAGLQKGDVILSVNNVEIKSTDGFTQALSHLDPKKAVALLIRRGGSAEFVSVKPD